MARKQARKPPDPPKPNLTRGRLILGMQVLLPILLGVALIVATITLGREVGQKLGDDARLRIPFSEIDCTPPASLSRELFLAEVRYLSGMPETISLVDRHDQQKIREAFALHPWVENVGACQVSVDRQLRVELRMRTPRLAIPFLTMDQLIERAVDTRGFLLPAFEIPADLPRLVGTRPLNGLSSGQRVRDSVVERALELAVELDAERIEYRETTWRITQKSGRVLTVKP